MRDFIARLKSYKAIRITFCWQNNFSQRQGTLLLLVFQVPPCLCSVFCHTCTPKLQNCSAVYTSMFTCWKNPSPTGFCLFSLHPWEALYLQHLVSCFYSALFLYFMSQPPLPTQAQCSSQSKWASLCLEKWGEQEKGNAVCKLFPSMKWSLCAKWHHFRPTADP